MMGGGGGWDASAKHEKKLSLMIIMIKSFLTIKHVKHIHTMSLCCIGFKG